MKKEVGKFQRNRHQNTQFYYRRKFLQKKIMKSKNSHSHNFRYNEAENLPICVWLIDKYLKDVNYEVIIIDDNSPDGTQV
jgi:hypothetical protein